MKYGIQKQQQRRADGVNLSGYTITTTDLFKNQPLLARKVYDSDSFNVNLVQYNRVAPMPVSSFCRIKNRAAAFYAKWSQIWKPYDAFYTGKPYAYGGNNHTITELPYVTSLDLLNFFAFHQFNGTRIFVTYQSIVATIQSEDDIYRLIDDHSYDFISAYDLGSNTPGVVGYKLTEAGRNLYSVFNLLGYRIPSYINSNLNAIGSETFHPNLQYYIDQKQDFLPLMAYTSILTNYYTPKAVVSFAFVNSFSYVYDPMPVHSSSFSNGALPLVVSSLLGGCNDIIQTIWYGDDYFTRSLQNLYEDLQQGFPDVYNVEGSSNNMTAAQNNQYRAPSVEGQQAVDNTAVTKYLLQVMYNFTDINQINAMSKNDIVSAAIAKFGYKPEVADMIPYLLDTQNEYIYISPEVAQADTLTDLGSGQTEGAPLGYKAGMGEGTLNLKGNYKFDANGIFIVVGSMSPDYFYYKGLQREMSSTTKDLVFDPNMSNVGAQALAFQELTLERPHVINPAGTMSFTSKFAELCQPISQLGGDFIVNTRSQGKSAFHFGRDLNSLWTSIANGVSALRSVQLARQMFSAGATLSDGGQYDRIFVDESAANDHVEQWNLFDIRANRPVAPYGDFTIGEQNGPRAEVKDVGVLNN